MHPAAKRLHNHDVAGDENNAEYEASEFGGFRQYFHNKQIKLDTQLREANQGGGDIFKDCHIYLNGRTEPSHTVLKQLIVSNGGSICAFLGGKTYATHIVAEYLTKRKNDQFAEYKVVKPLWVVNCVDQNKLLDWTKYRAIDTPLTTLDPKDTQRQIILEERAKVNCLDPSYISDYYSRSRLHFLSSRKAELRARCQTLVGQLPLAERPSPRVLMHVDYDSFFVSVALKSRLDLLERPVCVSWGGPSSDIASCNYRARESGVRNGMWVARAKEMCPDLICLSYDFEEYKRCSDILYEELVALHPDYMAPLSVDEALVDLTTLASRTDVGTVVSDLRETIRSRTGIEVSVGVGPNVFLAKMALRLAKPAGYVELTPENAPGKLANCLIKDMPGVGHHISAKLIDLGVSLHAHIKRVTEATLKKQLGNAMGTKIFEYGKCGDSDDISLFDQEPKSVGVELCWGVRLLNDEEVDQFVKNLVDELGTRIQSLYPETLTIKLYRRAADAPFVTPKYMGCGHCDVTSRTRRVLGLDLDGIRTLVLQCVQSFMCPPMDLRGIGLTLKLVDTKTPSGRHASEMFTKRETASRSSSPTKPRVQLPPSRRRGRATLSQFLHQAERAEVDMEVFDKLPSQIKREIMAHEDEFQIRVPVPTSRDRAGVDEPTAYLPVCFRELSQEDDLRKVIYEWVHSAKSPHYEDVCEFRDYIDEVFDSDWNWTKALSLVGWLQHCSQDRSADWQRLATIMKHHLEQKQRPA